MTNWPNIKMAAYKQNRSDHGCDPAGFGFRSGSSSERLASGSGESSEAASSGVRPNSAIVAFRSTVYTAELRTAVST